MADLTRILKPVEKNAVCVWQRLHQQMRELNLSGAMRGSSLFSNFRSLKWGNARKMVEKHSAN
jgi:hypothetical protein